MSANTLSSFASTAATDGGKAVVFLGIFVAALLLLVLRIELIATYARSFVFSGLSVILQMGLVYLSPLIVLLVASSPQLVGFVGWKGVAAAWIAVKVLALPFLWAMKPSFALFGAILFLQTSVGFALVAQFLDTGEALLTRQSLAITMAPLVSAVCTLVYYRSVWDKVWDVCLTIRYCEGKATQTEKLVFRQQSRRVRKVVASRLHWYENAPKVAAEA